MNWCSPSGPALSNSSLRDEEHRVEASVRSNRRRNNYPVLTFRKWDGLTKEAAMLGWALTFLVIALIAAALGFGGIAGASAGIAKIIFVIFLVLLLASLFMHLVRGRAP